GHELAQVAGGEQTASRARGMVTDDEQQPHTALVRQVLELVPEDDVALVDDPVDDDDVAAHVLHQRPDRRDADAAGDEQDLLPLARSLGEDAERTFSDDARARLELAEPAG